MRPMILALLAGSMLWSCGGDSTAEPGPADDVQTTDLGDAAVTNDATEPEDAPPEGDGSEPSDDPGPAPSDDGVAPDPGPELCADGLPKQAFQPGGSGTLRHELAGDFTLTRVDGIPWTLSEKWTGCDTYVFVPDTLKNSQMDSASIWQRDIAELVKRSPANVHYFFVSRESSDTKVQASTETMNERVAKELQSLTKEQSDEWWFRLHTVSEGAFALDGWLGAVLSTGIGQRAFAIDRFQRIRGVGSFADVFRFQQALSDAEM